jgi:hypothetical protein
VGVKPPQTKPAPPPPNPSATPPCASSSSTSKPKTNSPSTTSARTRSSKPASARPPSTAPKAWFSPSSNSSPTTRTKSPPCKSSTARPYKQRLTFEAVKELADAIEKPPYLWNESQLWNAYAALEASKVKGASGRRILTDLVSLVRFAIHQDNELVPFPERVNANFKAWLATQQQTPSPLRGEGGGGGERIHPRTTEMAGNDPRPHRRQPRHRAGRLRIRALLQQGGLGKVYQLFGAWSPSEHALIEQLNENPLAA